MAASEMPTGFLQRRLYEASPGGMCFDNVGLAFDIVGPFTADVLKLAFGALVSRHEALRTTICRLGGKPIQVISDGVGPKLCVTAVRDSKSLLSAVRQALLAPFDLEAGPLVRLSVISQHDGRRILVLVASHAIADGWSASLLARDLTELYGAAALGGSPHLPRVELQFADYAAWEQAHRHTKSERYWRDQVGRRTPRLGLPYRRRVAAGLRSVASLAPPVDEAAVTRLRRLAASESTTLATALHAAAVARLTLFAEGTVAIGVLDANRDRPCFRETVGCLFDIVPLIVSIPADATFRDVVRCVHKVTVAGRTHKLPLSRIVDLAPTSGCFPYAVTVNSAPPTSVPGAVSLARKRGSDAALVRAAVDPSLRTTRAAFHYCGSEYEYAFAVVRQGHLSILVEGNTQLFARSTLAREGVACTRFIMACAADPDRRVRGLL